MNELENAAQTKDSYRNVNDDKIMIDDPSLWGEINDEKLTDPTSRMSTKRTTTLFVKKK